MKQFRATQHTAEYGKMHLHIRILEKLIFIKGAQNSSSYVDKVVKDMERKGAVILKGNGGWFRVDIIRNTEFVKLGEVEFEVAETGPQEIEQILFDFYLKKFKEAKFIVQEVESGDI